METKIEAVLFDWGGVLIENPAARLMDYCARALDVSVENYTRVHDQFSEAFQKGLIGEKVFWRRVCGALERPVPKQASLWGEAFRAVYVPREEVFAFVRRLREGGYRTALLSNTEAPVLAFFFELGYDRFDALTFSCVEGVFKPEKEMYALAARKLRLAPEQCVLLDDRADFVAGARKAGMVSIRYENLAQARQDLVRLGVLVE